MARVEITVNDLPPNSKLNSLTWTNADSANNHYVKNDGKTILLALNGDGSTKTLTVVSVTDENGRTGDLAATVPAFSTPVDGVSVVGCLKGQLFNQAGGNQVNINVSSGTNLKLAALRVRR